jgi:hypothetical protein
MRNEMWGTSPTFATGCCGSCSGGRLLYNASIGAYGASRMGGAMHKPPQEQVQ